MRRTFPFPAPALLAVLAACAPPPPVHEAVDLSRALASGQTTRAELSPRERQAVLLLDTMRLALHAPPRGHPFSLTDVEAGCVVRPGLPLRRLPALRCRGPAAVVAERCGVLPGGRLGCRDRSLAVIARSCRYRGGRNGFRLSC